MKKIIIVNKETILKMAVIVLLCLISSLIFNHYTQRVPLFGYIAPYRRIQPISFLQDSRGEESIYISYEELIEFLGNPEYLIVDVRDKYSYEEGHIPEAVMFPLYEFDDYFQDFVGQHPPFLRLILYCSDVHCDMSKEMYYLLINSTNYEEILIYPGGYLEWIEKQGIDMEFYYE